MLIGYARVSTPDQNLNLQKGALCLAGCELILPTQRGIWHPGTIQKEVGDNPHSSLPGVSR
jgi:DNA invertase Pin-like site-specific DNA recombinase